MDFAPRPAVSEKFANNEPEEAAGTIAEAAEKTVETVKAGAAKVAEDVKEKVTEAVEKVAEAIQDAVKPADGNKTEE